MQVTPHERLRFYVESQSGQKPYLVDLGTYWGHGSCDCLHFKCRIEPKLARGERPTSRRACKHLAAAREYFADLCIERINNDHPDWNQET